MTTSTIAAKAASTARGWRRSSTSLAAIRSARIPPKHATGHRQVSECADALAACLFIAVADTKLSSAPRAAEKNDQQSFAAANGAAAHEPFAVGVVGNQGLIPLEVGPGNIALVMIGDQRRSSFSNRAACSVARAFARSR